MTKRTSAKNVGPTVWQLADFFRSEAPVGWRPNRIEFERQLELVRAAGMNWNVSLEVRAGTHEPLEVVVLIFKEARRTRRISARQRQRLFVFLETVEKTMKRLGYRGSFDLDRHVGGCYGHFHKSLKTTSSIPRELERLAALKLGALQAA